MIRAAARLSAELAGFAVLLFVTRFVLRGHLVPLLDQECHIGGIAIDVLAHGVRFPLLAYAPNEYDNGSFFSGLLAALSFALLGRSVLALKLVTHLIGAAGAVAALRLLRGCLDDLGITHRRARAAATAVLVIGIASAPRIVTLTSTYAVGNHAEGCAIDVVLLALFARLVRGRSAAWTAAFWALVGGALYLNKGTVLVLPVLALAEIWRSWRTRPLRRAALGGFLLGVMPELLVILQRRGLGWSVMSSKPTVHAFPEAFLDDLATLGEHRIELLALWAAGIVAGGAWLIARHARRGRIAAPPSLPPPGSAGLPVTLAMVLAFVGLHAAALTVMAQGGVDAYSIYSYPTLVVLSALPAAWLCVRVETRWGRRHARRAAAAAAVVATLLYRPDSLAWTPAAVSASWRDADAAACSWRFAEGFGRERDSGWVPGGTTREQHAVARCRSLSDQDQVLDCVGGMARELNWRRNGRVSGAPPAGLSAAEERAYAFHWGTHRFGDVGPCSDFEHPELTADCVAAARLECLVYTDMLARLAFARGLSRPHCPLREPPMNGYWAAMRRALLARPAGEEMDLPPASAGTDLRACASLLRACYPPTVGAAAPRGRRGPSPHRVGSGTRGGRATSTGLATLPDLWDRLVRPDTSMQPFARSHPATLVVSPAALAR